jgi:flagellar biogenesis protein FliO
MTNMPIHDWAQFTFSVIFVFLLLAACLWWLAKRKGGLLLNRAQKPIQIEDTLQLGIKHKLILIKVDGHKVLVSVTPTQMQTLHAWQAPSENNPDAHSQLVASTQLPTEYDAQSSLLGQTQLFKKSFKDSLGDAHGSN